MNKFNKKRSIYITIAIVTILLIGLGYAFLTSNLNIIGNTNINKNTWGVEFENVQVTEGSVEADTPQISNKTTVNYTVTLDKPGDYYEFNVDAVNKGSIDAMIDAVSNTGLTTEQKKYLTYSATYSDGTEVKPKQELNANAKETIKVRVEYKKDITASDLPSENQQLNLTFTIEYVQADDSSEEVVHPVCKRAATLHTEICNNTSGCAATGAEYNIGDTITYGNLGTKGTLKAGDAFDCDVNGDGTFDSNKERFYYVTSLDTDNNYGVLIYYNNVGRSAYDSANKPSENGPATAVQLLPTTSQWKNVSLSNTTRKIKDENGTEYIDFSYEGHSARLITHSELGEACGQEIPTYGDKQFKDCKYLLENTIYSNTSLEGGYWFETKYHSYEGIWIVHGNNTAVTFGASTQFVAVRPAIEVPKSKIGY